MEKSDSNPGASPLMNDAIPRTSSRDSFLTRFFKGINKYIPLGFLGVAIVASASLTQIDYKYQEQAWNIHSKYTAGATRSSDELALRLTVNEELNALRQQGHAPKSWAVDFYKYMGADNYVTPEGFERKR